MVRTESVSVNGRTDFSTTDEFDRDAKIVVTYHTFPSDDTEDEDVKNDETNSSSEEKEEVRRNDKHESDEDKKTVSSQETATQDKAAWKQLPSATILTWRHCSMVAIQGLKSSLSLRSTGPHYRIRWIHRCGTTARRVQHKI